MKYKFTRASDGKVLLWDNLEVHTLSELIYVSILKDMEQNGETEWTSRSGNKYEILED